MELFKKKAIELVVGLAITENKDPAVVPYSPAKLEILRDEEPSLPRRICGKKKKYARVLSNMLSSLEEEKRANVHSLIVVKDGEVIAEAAAPGYGVNTPHLAHSMSKTVTAIAIGMLVDDGKLALDEKVSAFFPELPFADSRFAELTVEDLLTMKSGVPFSEIGVVTSDKWAEDFFECEMTSAPGETFQYNSMNSYILAKIVTRVTGTTLSDFIKPRLFDPLGIKSFFWEKSPEGCEKGGFGLYLSAESFAKIGLMLLGNGKYRSRQILSKRFITKMLLTHSLASTDKGDFNYGYHVWVARDGSDYLLSGMLGQNVWVSPEDGIVVAINSGNNEIFQNSPALEIIRKALLGLDENTKSTRAEYKEYRRQVKCFFEERRVTHPEKEERGLLYTLGIKNKHPFDINWEPILGEYVFPDNNLGLMPLFVRVLQNNYGGGIEELELYRKGEGLYLTCKEGGVTYEYPIGIYGHIETEINYNGEKYRVRALGEATLDEFDNPIYKIELIYPELPNTRYITLKEEESGVCLCLSELPNQRIADKFLESFSLTGLAGFAMGALERKLGENFIEARLTKAFNPMISGIDKRITDCDEIISEKNKELSERKESSGKLINTLVSKFMGEDKSEKKAKKSEKDTSEKGFLHRAFKSLKSKLKGKKKASNSYDISIAPAASDDDTAKNSSDDENKQD